MRKLENLHKTIGDLAKINSVKYQDEIEKLKSLYWCVVDVFDKLPPDEKELFDSAADFANTYLDETWDY